MPGTQTSEADILFQDPWLNPSAEKPWGMSTELYVRNRVFSDYDKGQQGLWLNFDHQLTKQASIDTGVRHETTNIHNLDSSLDGTGPITAIEDAEGKTVTNSASGGFTWRNLDSITEPTAGFTGNFNLESAGSPLGGDVDFLREQATGEWFWKIAEDSDGHPTVLHPRFALGHVAERGGTDELPFFENYFVGGSSGAFALRGFDFQGVGPHESGNAIGDRCAAVTSLEALYPLITRYNPFRDEDETLLKAVVFAEAGNLTPHMSDLSTLWRSSAGLGMRLRIPALGGVTLSLDYAFLINSQPQDEERALSFELSRRF
jgi:outer membrane protein insertion porin family